MAQTPQPTAAPKVEPKIAENPKPTPKENAFPSAPTLIEIMSKMDTFIKNVEEKITTIEGGLCDLAEAIPEKKIENNVLNIKQPSSLKEAFITYTIVLLIVANQFGWLPPPSQWFQWTSWTDFFYLGIGLGIIIFGGWIKKFFTDVLFFKERDITTLRETIAAKEAALNGLAIQLSQTKEEKRLIVEKIRVKDPEFSTTFTHK